MITEKNQEIKWREASEDEFEYIKEKYARSNGLKPLAEKGKSTLILYFGKNEKSKGSDIN